MRLCREKVVRTEAQVELNLATAVKDNTNVSINTLETKGGLRTISFTGCKGKYNDKE